MHNFLSEKIWEIRVVKARMTQKKFAKLCGTTGMTVSRWESGISEPRPRHLIAIAQIAGITVDELLSEPEEPRRSA